MLVQQAQVKPFPNDRITTQAYGRLTARFLDQLEDYPAPVEAGIAVYDPFGIGTQDPFHMFEWKEFAVEIRDENGKAIFTEPHALFPADWDEHARSVVAQKYFHGDHDQGYRETSLAQLILRVSATIAGWAARRRTFATADDAVRFYKNLTYIQLDQMFAFNSPVYFNVGIDVYDPTPVPENYHWDESARAVRPCADAHVHPQISACFIQKVEDTIESIMALTVSEAFVFKRGSGSGSDLSRIRSRRERLSGGGKPSGPLSFMRIWDATAGVVQSGGKTRRAAKMQTLKCDHPDIIEFIDAKWGEEQKAQALIEAGYSPGLNGEAYRSVFFQNSNLSVRLPDWFMRKCEPGAVHPTYDMTARTTGEPMGILSAPGVLARIAERAWFCGDPGVQFEDVIQYWNTCADTETINSSNPCGEYNFLDDTACNLASLNVMKFRDPERRQLLHYGNFIYVIKLAITAMETMVDEASYPTAAIAERTHEHRTLGIGYANVGAFVMSNGWAYDSTEARTFFAGVSAVLTGVAYWRSAELARRFGPFPAWARNRTSMLRVMSQHSHAADQIESRSDSERKLIDTAQACWSEACLMGEKYGYRNAQASCIAPTGTIAFMMGCDTTGIEPEIALVRYKTLAGGGVLKIVNHTVAEALTCLGYDDLHSTDIQDHIWKYGTIQDVVLDDGTIVRSGLNPDHLPVFDCAFPPSQGQAWKLRGPARTIAPLGHVRAVEAAQPFVSGAISKTINVPADVTPKDIRDIYMGGWERGCKALAVYRDGSKSGQPLSTSAPEGKQGTSEARHDAKAVSEGFGPAVASEGPTPQRRRLPATRQSVTHKFSVAGHEGYVTVGHYEDGAPGEVFITLAKNGSTVGGLFDVFGTSLSIGLQYGVPLEKYVQKFSDQRFEPAGITSNPDVPFCKSIVDYIFKWLGCQYVIGYLERVRPLRGDDETPARAYGPDSLEHAVTESAPPSPRGNGQSMGFAAEIHGAVCPNCGQIMVQQGPCQVCFHCAYTNGGCGG